MSQDVDDITQVLVRYATAIDTRDWSLFRTCFTDDAVTDYGEIGAWRDLDGLTAFMVAAHERFGATNHCMSNYVVEVHGDRATARSYVHVVLVHRGAPGSWIDSVGSYDDTLVHRPDGWKIATRTFHHTRTFSHP